MNLLITGSIAYDEIMDFPGEFKDYFHPEKLHQINISFVVDRLEKQIGGTATNIAYNIAQIFNFQFSILNQYQNSNFQNKKSEVRILGAVGRDGKVFLDFFKKNKIDISGVIVDKRLYTATGKVMTDKNDNQIWGFYYGACESAKKISLKEYAGKDSLLVISATHPDAFLHFQEEAIKYKIDYMYDPGMALTWIKDKDLKKGVINTKYLVGNDYEIAMITKRLKKTVNELTSCGLKLITTLGEEGVKYEYKSKIINPKSQINPKFEIIKVPAYKVKKVVDPTGAGDAWRGGFIAGIVSGKSIIDSLKLGNVMASFAIEEYGTVNHKPTIKEINKRMKKLDTVPLSGRHLRFLNLRRFK